MVPKAKSENPLEEQEDLKIADSWLFAACGFVVEDNRPICYMYYEAAKDDKA